MLFFKARIHLYRFTHHSPGDKTDQRRKPRPESSNFSSDQNFNRIRPREERGS